ncbi:DUF6083 domain-containing protein [Streptomyces cucumeris]|uniref:DUF6083 domain-containing protein n=1 Tax=Streptomyces cucumeris TaxID=2962890 RepID=UPI003D74AD79
MNMWLHRANQTSMLRSTGADRCKYCGIRVDWFDRYDTKRIPLTPEIPAKRVPDRFQWHVDKGVAYPGADQRAGGYCRLPHPAVCPAVEHHDMPEELADIVMRLGVRMHNSIARGEFVPAAVPEAEEEISEPDPEDSQDSDGTRHTISYHGALRLAPCQLEDIQCIAALEDGERCPNGILDVDEGRWEQIGVPYAPGRAGRMILSQSDGKMWVWSLTGDFTTVLRWFKQRCGDHYQHSTVPDHGPRELTEFHVLRHADFIVTQRPEGYDPPPTPESFTIHEGPRKPQRCVGPGCFNSTVSPVAEEWLCWQCARTAKRRERVHRRWQKTDSGQ